MNSSSDLNCDNGWRFSWRAFVEKIAEGLENGETDKSLSSRMGGARVHWEGRVREVKNGLPGARGVSLDMESIDCVLGNGFTVKGWYVFLNSTEEEMKKLMILNIKGGDCIEFSADLSSTNPIFGAVSLSVFDSEKKIHLRPLLRGVEVTSVNGSKLWGALHRT